MKSSLIFVYLLFLSSAINAQVNDADAFFNCTYDKRFIKAKRIKSIAVNNFVNDLKVSSAIFYFNHEGFLIRESISDSNRNKINDYFFRFNKQGDLIARKNINYEIRKTSTENYTRVYKNNKIFKEYSRLLSITTEYTYNNKSQKVQATAISNAGNTFQNKRITKYIYDTTGKLIETSERLYNNINDTLGSLVSHRLIKYKDGRVVKEEEKIFIDSDIPWNKGTIEYDYDGVGNLISRKSNKIASRFYSYDRRGLILTEKIIMPDEFKSIKSVDKYSYSFWK